MKTPESMIKELEAWNNGAGVDLDTWRSSMGNFSLAVAYAALFNPTFVLYEDYIIQAEEIDEYLIEAVKSYENQGKSNQYEVEWILNHEHIADLQYLGCEDLTVDKILLIGNALKDIYEAKLALQFPDRPCTVELYIPEDESDLRAYQVAFWQTKHK